MNSGESRMEFVHHNVERLMKEREISKEEALCLVTETKDHRKCPAGNYVDISIKEENGLYYQRIVSGLSYEEFFGLISQKREPPCVKVCGLCKSQILRQA